MASPTTERAWFWAKLGNHTWPEQYHPVACHLIDVGQAATALWEHALRAPQRRRIATQLGLDSEEAGKWVAFWVAAHDIGKLTPAFQFQGKTEELKSRLATRGYKLAAGGKPPHHTATGTRILCAALVAGTGGVKPHDRALAVKVAVCVGGHHGRFPASSEWERADIGDGPWAQARADLLAQLAHLFAVDELKAPQLLAGADQSVWLVIAGLTAVADWIGSNVTFFPPHVTPERPLTDAFDLDTYFAHAGRAAADALLQLGWLDRTEPTGVALSFPDATGIAKPRPLQEKVIPLAREMAASGAPRLLVVEAPMGEGKTEAAWYAADCWDRCGGAGTYVALPTMATSNQMFERVAKFLRAGGGKQNLMLLHGKAALNDQFEKLRFAAEVYDHIGGGPAVVAEAWFATNKKHALLAPVGVGTIDQALLAVLQTNHGFVRLFGLAGKCVILDEVHAYDAYMTTLMERLLTWLAALGCPVVLLSATLPASKREQLIRAYAGKDTPAPEATPYPRVTSVAVGGAPAAEAFAADPTRRKTIPLEWVEDAILVGNLSQTLAEGGCAVVIRNTVGLAQETYQRLRQEFTGTDVEIELFHARFPFGRRQAIEGGVLKRYGRMPDDVADAAGTIIHALHRPKKAILVATQVVEQSLDLDFDVMYTDVAPADLVLQRAGRLHRHARGARPAPLLRLIAPGTKADGRPDFGKSEFVYARFVLLRSFYALRAVPVVTLPDDLESLVEQVYGAESPDVPADAADDLAVAKAEHETKQQREEDEAGVRQIKPPTFSGALARIIGEPLDEENPDLHPAHQALTRLTRPTAQLICLNVDGAGVLRLPHNDEPVPTLDVRPMSVGGVADVKRLLLAELTVADMRVLRELWRASRVPGEWGKVGMLQRHHLVTFQNGRAVVGDAELQLDFDLGLRVVRATGEGDE